MSCLGVHFALTEAEVAQLRAFTNEAELLDHVVEDIEVTYFEHYREYLAQSDKAWDAMHRVLADGELTYSGGEYPLSHVVLGGEILYSGDDYIMSLKTPDQVRDIAAALPAISEAEFRKRYDAIDPTEYGFPKSDVDFDYTWAWFQDVRTLYQRAATDGRYVLFTADQ